MDDQPLTAATAWGEAPDTARGSNLPEYTVSELSLALKRSIEDGFGHVRVRGEVSGFKRHGSGHCYFALKDAEAVIDAVCWRLTAIRLAVRPEDGMEVVCTGRLTTYPGRSKYQLVVDTVELAGQGALPRPLEERRPRRRGIGDPADLGGRPRDRHDLDRPCQRPPRTDPDGGGGDGGAGAARPRRRAQRQDRAPRRRPGARAERTAAAPRRPRARPARPAGSARRRRAASR